MSLKAQRDASAVSLGAASTRSGGTLRSVGRSDGTLSRQNSLGLSRQNSASLSRQSLSRQSSQPRTLRKKSSKALFEEREDTEDFDMGAFFNFAEWYGDEPYMTMALNMFEKAPPGSALRSPTMLQVLSRRFQEEREPDPETMDERDRCISTHVMFTLPSMEESTGSFKWDKVSYRLPVERDRQSREYRIALLKFLDRENSGRMSIPDLKLGFARIVSMPGLVDPEHMLDEVVRHAQRAVQDLMLDGAPRKDDDVLTKEFRVFLTFLQGYLDLWEIFFEVDNSSDEMVTLDEFIQAAPKLKEWGLKDPALMKNPAHLFAQIDEDESGFVTFGEFADFCVRKGLMEEVANDLRNI